MFKDPFDPKALLGRRCGCGGDHAPAEHARLAAKPCRRARRQRWNRVVDAAVLRAVFPVDAQRRAVPEDGGRGHGDGRDLLGAAAGTAREAFAQGGAPEKKDLKVGFIPITCATPIIMAHPMGFYSKHGLDVEVVKTAGWAVIRDKSLAKEYDAAHMLSPMPLAISLGVGSNPVPWTMPAIENINGQAITLAMKHKDKRDPKDWKGFSSPCRSTTRCTTTCCATTWPSTGSIPTRTSRSARCRRPRWWPTCGPTISTAISAPTLQPARGL